MTEAWLRRGRLVGDGAGEVSSCTGMQPCFYVFIMSVATFMLLGQSEQLRQRTYDRQNQKYLLYGPLQKKQTNLLTYALES